MNKLSKKQHDKFESVKGDCTDAADALTNAIDEFNGKVETVVETANAEIEELYKTVESALSEYNDAVTEAKAICEETNGDQESYFDERSERWQEGERGEAYREWADSWENAASECDAVDASAPAPLEAVAIDATETPHEGLDELPTEFEF